MAADEQELPALRAAVAEGRPVPSRRAYPVPAQPDDHEALTVQLAATRALLTATTPREVLDIAATFVRDLGGGLVPARLTATGLTTQGTLPLDVSLGLTEPLLPWAEPVSIAAMRLSDLLPGFLEDARGVAARLRAEQRQVVEADRDALTGLLNRRAWMRLLGAAPAGAVIALVDLDHFKHVNDTAGHPEGDTVLREFGAVLLEAFRDGDRWGRYGGDEMACLVTAMTTHELAARLEDVRRRWERRRPPAAAGVGFTAGIAEVRAPDPRTALRAADVALYRAKRGGRNATSVASDADYASG